MSYSYGQGNRMFTKDSNGRILAYTDGCCFNNGRANAWGGYGVYFGPNHLDNVSQPLPAGRQTNQRAEILAAYHALRILYNAGFRRVDIRTDSHFVKDCVEQFIPKWKSNGWITSAGHTAVNKEELELLDGYDSIMDVIYTHVPRDSDPWNTEADMLAKEGAGR